MQTTPVLVVGGSLVGLSSAMFLAHRGVPTVLVEKHLGSSPHPRAMGYTARTLELFRGVGLESRIPTVPTSFKLRRVRVESLAGKWFDESLWTPAQAAGQPAPKPYDPSAYSPFTGASMAQDQLEPLLREKAIEFGADLRLGTRLTGFEQDAGGVTAHLCERDGKEYALRADYLVATDGASSPIREALGIGRSGRGHMKTVRSVLFRAPLDQYLEEGTMQFEIDQPDFKAFLVTYNDGRWALMFEDDVERDEATLREAVFQAIGRRDLPVEILATGRWELGALVADRFSSGRVFLAGDAAHTLPPTRGGYGANTGIQDAHNLAWKLDSVLSGASTPSLLDTYSLERRPVAWLRHQQTFARSDYARYRTPETSDLPIIDDAAMEFGQIYHSSAVIGADENLPPALCPDEWNGQPGTRAPHLWDTKDDEGMSTLDLFGRGWVLLAWSEPWESAAIHAGEVTGIELECLRIGHDLLPENEETWSTAFGVGQTGASLIRPDGFVAWRATDLPADPEGDLTEALSLVSCAARAAVLSV